MRPHCLLPGPDGRGSGRGRRRQWPEFTAYDLVERAVGWLDLRSTSSV